MKALTILLTVGSLTAVAQVAAPFTSSDWIFANNDYVHEEYLGKPSVLLRKNQAVLKTASFEDGVIELDVAFPQTRDFVGISFRMQDEANFEHFYFRPHQSGNPDANQYTPVYGGNSAWQLYYGKGYATPFKYSFNAWMHVKLVISGKYLEVYVDDMEKPILMSGLKREPSAGYVGVGNSNGETHFANFRYTPNQRVSLKSSLKTPEPIAKGLVAAWEVSNAFAEKKLDGVQSLGVFDMDTLTWKKAVAENTGMLNIASVEPGSADNNTVLVKTTIHADQDELRKFLFGFSDRARVYFNNMLLYSGDDKYSSRDYRFLGTVGFYDAVYLQLRKGPNEVIIAVSEDFGGWGVMGSWDVIGDR